MLEKNLAYYDKYVYNHYIMLHRISSLGDPLCELVRDDPIRPTIPLEFRVSAHSDIFVLQAPDQRVRAVVCVCYRDSVPHSQELLVAATTERPQVAIFYTIWSYAQGAGRELIFAVRSWIRAHRPEILDFVTLSPCTELARRFHLRNGAEVLSVNSDTVNYIYR